MEGLKFSDNIEKPKWHYVYSNNEISGRPVVFQCDAEDISEADRKFEEKIGKAPDKLNHIGCSAIKN